MEEKKVFVGDEWVILVIDLKTDLTVAQNPVLEVKKPNGSVVTWIPTIFGKTCLRYTPSGSDIDQPGEYKIQPVLTLQGKRGRGTTVTLVVHEKFT